jgi:hypothetical protein
MHGRGAMTELVMSVLSAVRDVALAQPTIVVVQCESVVSAANTMSEADNRGVRVRDSGSSGRAGIEAIAVATHSRDATQALTGVTTASGTVFFLSAITSNNLLHYNMWFAVKNMLFLTACSVV